MSLVTYYFNAYDSGGEEWSVDPAFMVDGSTVNRARTTINNDVQLLNGNTGPGDNLGIITKVELLELLELIELLDELELLELIELLDELELLELLELNELLELLDELELLELLELDELEDDSA